MSALPVSVIPQSPRRRARWHAPALALGLALAAWALSMAVGSIPITLVQMLDIVAGTELGLPRRILLELRIPRAASAFATGGLLAISGALIQVMIRNPLGDPYVLGISGGAAVFALIAIAFGWGGGWLELMAFCGAMLSMLIVFSLASSGGRWSTNRLLLTGVIVASGWGAMIALILSVAPDSKLRGMIFWLIGDLSATASSLPACIALAVGLPCALCIAKDLNVLGRGDMTAASLGVNVRALHGIVYLLSAMMTAISVTTAGSIGFVGLVVPHILRLMGVNDMRILLPTAALAGGSVLLLADTLARTVIAPQQLPVGVITALIGIPLFLYLLQRR